MDIPLEGKLPFVASSDPWRYGERYLRRVCPDGRILSERVPLPEEGLIFPQESDKEWQTVAHSLDCNYLTEAFDHWGKRRRQTDVFFRCRIDFGVSSIPPMCPDVFLITGDHNWDVNQGPFPMAGFKARSLLVVEVATQVTRHLD